MLVTNRSAAFCVFKRFPVSLLLVFELLLLLCRVMFTDSRRAIILSPPQLRVFEGGEAVLACSPFDLSSPPILIQQDSYILLEETEPRLKYYDFPPSNRTYTLRNVSREDNGTMFRCVIGDFVSNEVSLKVYALPRLGGPSGRMYFQEDMSITEYFHYEDLSGFPAPHSITWLLDGKPFHGNNHIHLLNMNSTLQVKNPSRVDSGNYTLSVVSTAGQASISLDIRVTYNEFILTPKNTTVKAGEMITLNCKHRFGWTYAWITDRGGPISNLGSKVSISSDIREFHYGPVNYTDHLLEITCIVHSVDRRNFFISQPAVLSVESPPKVIAPMAVFAEENKDSGVILSFDVHSFPPYHSLVYEHSGHAIEFDTRIMTLNNGSLLIQSPTKRDAGWYTLHVMNTLGNASTAILLTIFYAPKVRGLNNSFVVQINTIANISCGVGVDSLPFPSFQWFYQDDRGFRRHLPPNRFSFDPINGVLTVESAQYEDSGNYVCIATNSVGRSSVSVNILVLDPPGSPLNPTIMEVGQTWAVISWFPPTQYGSIGPISKYALLGVPQPTNYSNNSVESDSVKEKHALLNSACIELKCEARYEEVPANQRILNLTGLIPAVNYTLVVFAFSNGSNLKSDSSNQVNFTTELYVPGVGSVTSEVHGPGLAQVTWKLTFSGGLPVEQFSVEYRQEDKTEMKWRNAGVVIEREGESYLNSSISPLRRDLVVQGLEASEFYVFRVSGSNQLGIGEYRETNKPLLSHHLGVPSPPTQPHIIGWTDNSVTINTTLFKLGSRMNFTLNLIVILNDVEVSNVKGVNLSENYTLDDSVELTLTNVSYRRKLRFVVYANNYLGCSLPSKASFEAHEFIQQKIIYAIDFVGITLWTLMSLLNAIAILIVMILCRVAKQEIKKQKKSSGTETVRDQSDAYEPFSPPSTLTFGDFQTSVTDRSIVRLLLRFNWGKAPH